MTQGSGLYFVIAEDGGRVIKWASDAKRPRADAVKAEFEKMKGLEACKTRIEFKHAAQCADFVRALERMKRKVSEPSGKIIP